MASGKGSNLKAIIKAQKTGKISSKVVLVISNNSASGALLTAKRNGIPAYHLSQKLFSSEAEFVKKFLSLLKEFNIGLIVLAGYMKKINPVIIRKFKNKIINIHPALLPSFGGKGMYGIYVHEAVLESDAKVTGATVHIVDDKYDSGPIVIQKAVKVEDDDTPEELQKRVLKTEHRLYPEAIKLFESKKAVVKGKRVYFK
ncbi:MAG: phosphoribosylglycinamide formyltransferase [Chlorobi bacterium]|nr:phosphoribosylglycinamide formyltransferase [Chlorobiota bacterium]